MNRLTFLCLSQVNGLGSLSPQTRQESPDYRYEQGRQNILDAKSRKPNNRKAKNIIFHLMNYSFGFKKVDPFRK